MSNLVRLIVESSFLRYKL